MTEQTEANIIELFDGAKDKEEQIRMMAKMGFGTKREIIDLLHETGRAANIIIRKAPSKKEEPEEEKEEHEEPAENETKYLPLPQDVKQLLVDELEGIDQSIKEIEEIIQHKEEEKKRLEKLYKHIVECVNV